MSDNYGKKHTFAAWLNEQFKLRPDLSNRQLAKKLGVQLNLIGKWRRGDVKKPKYENLHKLADIFEEDFDLLVAIAYGSHESIIAESLVEPQFTSTIIEDKQIFGRTNDLEKLIEHSQQSRLLFITGISGIGKSYLAKAFYDSQPQEKFLCKCYHYTSVKDIAEDIGVFSQHDLINDAIKLILQKLNRDRCLLILDNLDLDHQDHGDAYNQLLEQIAETEHQSYVIVTSRSQPKGWRKWEPRPKILGLNGLSASEAIPFLADQGLFVEPKAAAKLVQHYGGSPWGLKLAVQDILEKFEGDLSAYLQYSTVFAGDLHEEIRSVIELLTKPEMELLYWLVLQDEAVYFADIVDFCRNRSKSLFHSCDRDNAVDELHRRSLLQYYENEFVLPNEVQKCAENILLKEIYREIEAITSDADLNKLHWLSSLDLSDTQINLRKRFSRHETTLIQAIAQLEAKAQESTTEAIGYGISNLKYLLMK